MKILLPVDGSDYTKRMLGYVAAHEELFGPDTEFVVFTVVAPVPPQVTHFISHEVIDDYYTQQAEEVLEPVRAFAKQKGWSLRAEHAVGHAAESIAEMARRERPDMIVLGSHGHSALGNVILGSVASGVLSRCRAPVLIGR